MMMSPRSFLYSRQQAPPHPPKSAPGHTSSRKSVSASSLKRKDERTVKSITNATSSTVSTTDAMAKRKEIGGSQSPPSRSPTSVTESVARPITPTSALQIPTKSKHDKSHNHKTRHNHHSHHHGEAHRRSPAATAQKKRDLHSPDAIPASVAALLAVTAIPPPARRASLRQRQPKQPRMTVDSIVPRSQISEKELSEEFRTEFSLSSSLSGSLNPMDVLMSPPEDMLDDEAESIISEGAINSVLSARAESFESLPSLAECGDSLDSTTMPSADTPQTPRTRVFRPPRRSLEPVITPPGEVSEDPLSISDEAEIEHMEFKVFDPSPTASPTTPTTVFFPLKTVFKSNLTASLRALRSAAKTLSTFTASSVPAEDLLTRSILKIDPQVPFTDERRPPVLEEEPSEAMRRYLNPTSNVRLDIRTGTPSATRGYTASIQMQTYKVQRSRSVPAATNRSSSGPSPNPTRTPSPFLGAGPRQRETRENSDFIRIAVMEHLMRKKGKFDVTQEGHARWLLPARKPSTKPYAVGADGVPVRWIAVTAE